MKIFNLLIKVLDIIAPHHNGSVGDLGHNSTVANDIDDSANIISVVVPKVNLLLNFRGF